MLKMFLLKTKIFMKKTKKISLKNSKTKVYQEIFL